MAMIYGGITFDPSQNISKKASEISMEMSWPDAIHQKICRERFYGGFIYDPHLPHDKSDFYFIDDENQIVVLMTGVIYNRDEISIEFTDNLSSLKEPELINHLFLQYGPDFVKQLNGDFAIVILCKKTGQAFLFRDHLGIRPLAYSFSNNTLWFSSDMLSLSKAIYSKINICPEFILNQLITFTSLSWPLIADYKITPDEKISKVLPGHYVNISKNGISQNKYWFPESISEDKTLTYESVMKDLDEIVTDSVKIRCDNRYNASTHLSGGIDSGIIAALARKEYIDQKEFGGFMWDSSEKKPVEVEYDERIMAQQICDFCGINLLYQGTNPTTYNKYISDWRNSTDLVYEPEVRHLARQKGINLIFSGWGGDEFVSISEPGIDSDLLFKFQWFAFFKKNPLNKPKQLLAKILIKVVYPALGKVRYFNKNKKQNGFYKYINPDTFKVNRTVKDIYTWRSRRQIHLKFLYNYHIPFRTEDWAINGFRQGIEYRYPLLDKRIIEYILKVPSKLLFKKHHLRVVLREISKDILPDEVRWRKSMHDPVRVAALEDTENKLCLSLVGEIDKYKANPDLRFIDFALLEKEIKTILRGPDRNNIREQLEILIAIKKVDAFTKGYYE